MKKILLRLFCFLFVITRINGDIIPLNSATGTQSSQSPYSPNQQTRWVVTIPDQHKFVNFQLNTLDVEGYTPDCNYDYVLLVPGTLVASLGALCSAQNRNLQGVRVYCNGNVPVLPANVFINSNMFAVEFCSDDFIQANGFTFGWQTVDSAPSTSTIQPPTPTPSIQPFLCGSPINLSGQSVSITTPNFYGPYPNNALCSWSVTSSTGAISITSNYFDVEGYSTNCYFDYLLITSVAANYTQVFCGTLGPNLYLPSGSAMLKFISSPMIARFGFNLTLSPGVPTSPPPTVGPICGSNIALTNPNSMTYIYSPGWPNSYPNNASCQWFVTKGVLAQNLSLAVTVVFFKTETTYDTVTLLPSVGQSSVLSGRNINNGTVYVFNAASLNISFKSDSSLTELGFALKLSVHLPPFSCSPGYFKCTTVNQCIPENQLCDGTAQCSDNSDETDKWCAMGRICGTQVVPPNINIPINFPAKTANFIVGGSASKPGSWPWTVGIYFFTAFQWKFSCAGTLIAPHWVLTAAHCAKLLDPQLYKAYVGSYNQLIEDTPFQQDLQVAEIFLHPKYNELTISHDLALLKLAQNVTFPFNAHVNAICLPGSNSSVPVGTNCVATGWGSTGSSSSTSPVLNQAILPIYDLAVCNNSYVGQVDSTMLCAGYQQGGEDICSRDGGGPLMCQDPNSKKWFLQGITSWGSIQGCGIPNKPGVFAKVSSMLRFIYDTMALND